VARSAHFTVHFAVPSLERKGRGVAVRAASSGDGAGLAADLSTGQATEVVEPVDDFRDLALDRPALVWRLGLVLPKKMARRSVTRSLIKHQARELWRLHAPALQQAGWVSVRQPVGNWVLRLKAPWPKTEFPSAASEPLKQLVRAELLAMLGHLSKPRLEAGGPA
jgi:ribonuclease P protein component